MCKRMCTHANIMYVHIQMCYVINWSHKPARIFSRGWGEGRRGTGKNTVWANSPAFYYHMVCLSDDVDTLLDRKICA